MTETRPASAPAGLSPGAGRLGALWAVRLVAIVLGVCAWFFTQHLIGTRAFAGNIGDGLLDLLKPLNVYLHAHVGARNALLISSSAVIDLLTLGLFARSIFGPTLRPFVGMLVLFGLRQIFQGLCVLPMPDGMIWPAEGPGFPSLFVTYGVSNDLFFSGHTALAVYGAIELVRLGRTRRVRAWLIPLGVAIALFEVFAVLALYAHWTMDVYAGAVSAILVALLAPHIARPVDALLGKITGQARDSLSR